MISSARHSNCGHFFSSILDRASLKKKSGPRLAREDNAFHPIVCLSLHGALNFLRRKFGRDPTQADSFFHLRMLKL